MGTIFESLPHAAHFDNGEAVQGALSTNVATYTTGSVSSSTDPFSGKTNKFAQTKLVRVYGSATWHAKWSSAGTAATTNDSAYPAGAQLFAVEDGIKFLRLIPDSGSATFWVDEVSPNGAS